MAATKTKIIHTLRGGQITIPHEFRRELGIDADTMLEVTVTDGELRLKPQQLQPKGAGSPWLKELDDLFAPVREELSKYSEEEINEAIDAAVKAVRYSKRA